MKRTDFEILACKLGVCKADHCPTCQTCMKGEPIPQESIEKNYYGTKTHFSRLISIYDREKDRTVRYKCPDCSASWIA